MQRTTLLLFFIVLGIVLSLVSLVSKQTLRTPQEVLAEVQDALELESFDEQVLLRRLDASLRRNEPTAAGNPEQEDVCADLRLTRGKILLRIGATEDARTDFEQILERYRPGDREARSLMIQAESAEGHTQAALQHLEKLLKDEPAYAPAWVERGRLHQQLAEEILDVCREKLNFALVEQDAESAHTILRKLSARDPFDPRRTTTLLNLRNLFPPSAEEIFGQVLGLCEEASKQMASSRTALVYSFSLDLDTKALGRYIEILRDADQVPEALQLGGLVALPGMPRSDPRFAEMLIRLLVERGNHTHAAQLAAKWVADPAPLSLPFLELSCEALLRGREWQGLNQAAWRLRSIGLLEDEDIYLFYQAIGTAQSNPKKAPDTLPLLQRFARSTSREPFIGARSMAWQTIARLQKVTENIVAEREAIQAALALDPDNGPLWLRRAEIQRDTKHGGYVLPLESWLKGMALMPRRTEELLPTFISLGERRLKAEEGDLEVLFRNLVQEGKTIPSRGSGPFVLWSIASMHAEAEDYVAQAAAGKQLTSRYPGFIPGLDQLIDARLALGDREIFIRLVLERIALAGIDRRSKALLEEISLDEFSPSQLLVAMQTDPSGIGRRVATDWYHNNGDKGLAIKTLESSTGRKRTDRERILGARILISNGDFLTAMHWLDQISDKSLQLPTKLRLAVECSLQMRRPKEVARRTIELLEKVPLGTEDIFALTDSFLREHEVLPARALIVRVERTQVDNPGDLLLREVHVALLSGELDLARDTIERAAAFLTKEQYLIARLLLNAAREDWTDAKENAQLLAETGFATSGLRPVWIGLCTGQEQELLEGPLSQKNPADTMHTVARNLALLLTKSPLDKLATFGRTAQYELLLLLQGNAIQGITVDPREIAVFMLAAESAEFRNLIIGTLKGFERSERGLLWGALLAGELSELDDRRIDGMQFFDSVVHSYPDSSQTWMRMELSAVARYGTPLHPQVRRVRNRHRRALAEVNEDGPASLLADARKALRKGDMNTAIRATLAANELAPDWYEAHSAAAELATELKQWQEALDIWQQLIHESQPHEALWAFEGFLKVAETLLDQDPPPIPLEDLKATLGKLNKTYPDNPGCILALARLDLVLDKANPSLGLARAWSRMRALRNRHPASSLEDLQRGATKDWAHFYLDTDPGSAESFIQSELERQPGNLELWLLLGRVRRELGQYDSSAKVLGNLSIISPSAETQAEKVRTTVAAGASPRRVNRELTELYNRSGGKTPEGRLLSATALLAEFHEASWESAVTELEAIWEERHQLELASDRQNLALLYGRALILRNQPDDLTMAVNVLEVGQQSVHNSYQREQFASMIGVAKSRFAVKE